MRPFALMTNEHSARRILLGRVVGAFGVRGEIKLESWTEPRSAIFKYQPWILRSPAGVETELSGARGRDTGKHLVATFPGVEDRDVVESMRGTEVYVARSALPPPKDDEFYWVDLEGMEVVTTTGQLFGTVSHLFSTGANDVLVVRGDRERMIPWVRPDFVVSVDFDANRITVDWDPDF